MSKFQFSCVTQALHVDKKRYLSLWHSPHFSPTHVPYISHFYLLSSHNVSQPITPARIKWYLKARIANASMVLQSSQDKSQISNNVRLGYFTRALFRINYSLSNSNLTGPLHSLFLFFLPFTHSLLISQLPFHFSSIDTFIFSHHPHSPTSHSTLNSLLYSFSFFLHTHRLACHIPPFLGFCNTHLLLFLTQKPGSIMAQPIRWSLPSLPLSVGLCIQYITIISPIVPQGL